MNLCELGDTVRHRTLGTGKVARLLGPNSDDGIQIKLDKTTPDGKRYVSVQYEGKDGKSKLPYAGGWRRVSKIKESGTVEEKAEALVEQLLS